MMEGKRGKLIAIPLFCIGLVGGVLALTFLLASMCGVLIHIQNAWHNSQLKPEPVPEITEEHLDSVSLKAIK